MSVLADSSVLTRYTDISVSRQEILTLLIYDSMQGNIVSVGFC